jgi:branched-chain amino acid transport system ATP-binding protein
MEALKGISFKLDKGLIGALIGANGAGKSTTLNTISGITTPDSGEIHYMGKRIDGLPPDKIVGMGISQIPEGRRVFPQLTVLENLKMGAYLRRDKENIVKDLEIVFQRFPILRERFRQSGGSLSGGEQQMLAVGRSLMSRPKLLLMDEPTMGLSPLLCKAISEVIIDINQSGIGILLVEQNARMALKLSSKGFILETGRLTIEGESHVLMNSEYIKKAYLGE